jgi:hypothetical protein
MPVTSPLGETVATAVFDDVHVNVPADFGGEAVAESCTVPFTAMLADDGETVTDFTPGPPRAIIGSVGTGSCCGRSVHEITSATTAKVVATDGSRWRMEYVRGDGMRATGARVGGAQDDCGTDDLQ